MGTDVNMLHAQAAKPVDVDALEVDVPLLTRRVIKGSASAPRVWHMAAGTSSSVSKQHWLMAGPRAQSRSFGSVPKASCIFRAVLAARPAATPRQPA